MAKIGNIRVGRRSGSLVVAQRRPVISWQILGAGKSLLQTSYEIQISDDIDFIENVGTSGEIRSSSVIQAPWPAKSLKSREVRYLRVKAEVNGLWTPWSTPVTVEAPLFANKDWKAFPIALPDDPGKRGKAPCPIYRKEFYLQNPVSKSRLYVTSLGLFDVWINGVTVSSDLFNPGWTTYQDRIAYQTYDVSKFLKTGKNTISMTIADGWYRGNLTWKPYRNVFGDTTAALCQLEISDSTGASHQIVTDKSWKVSTGEIRSADIYDGVVVDFNEEHNGWRGPDFDDSKWQSAEELSVFRAALFPMTSPPVRVTEQIEHVSATKTPRGTTIYDFGQNMAGHVRLKVQGQKGDTVILTHAEVLKGGELHRALLRTAKAEDIYTLSHDGEYELTPSFTFHGFRYAEIETNTKVLSVMAEAIHSDVTRIGQFECSNEKLNKLHSNTMWSQRGNFVSIPTDCPQRDERLGWTGDAQAFAPTASTIFDCENFLSSWMLDVALEQKPDGAIVNFAPDVPVTDGMFANSVDSYGGRAGWGDAATIVPWALYEAYGDVETLRDQYQSMVRWVEYLEAKSAVDGLIPAGEFQFGDWLDPDAPSDKPWAAKCDSTYISNAFYAFSTRLLAKIAKILDRADDHRYYSKLAESLSTAVWEKWSSEIVKTATGCASAIELEIAPEGDRSRVATTLAKLVEAVDGRISTGFLGTPLVMPALSKYGHFDAAYKLLLNEEVPGWLYQINNGATSMWERWDAILPDGSFQSGDLEGADNGMISFNHYAYGAVTSWMYRNVAGISPVIDKPGYEEILFAPTPHESLIWAKASVETRFGTASIDWKKSGLGYEATIVVPSGATGWFVSPNARDEKIQLGSGSHAISF